MRSPILFIVFNRPDTTQVVFDAIRKAQPRKLFIAADAPRKGNTSDLEKCAAVKNIVEHIDWECEVERLYQKENLGCGRAVSSAINWFFSKNEEGIILEDDCVPNPDFYTFCDEMLEKYRNNEQVISINGSNLGYRISSGHSYTFSRFMNMWGWATWRRSAVQIDYEMKEWEAIKDKKAEASRLLKQGALDFDIDWFNLWVIKFNKVLADPGFTWDWQWMWYQLKNKKLSVVPGKNLISNIGFNENGTHTLHADHLSANIPAESMQFPLVHPPALHADLRYEEERVKWIWCHHKRLPLLKYLFKKVKAKLT